MAERAVQHDKLFKARSNEHRELVMDAFSLVVRLKTSDAHYGGSVIAGAKLLELFGDAVTGVTALCDGDEGLLAGWDDVRFLKVVHPGDFVRIRAEVTKKTKLRRFVRVTALRFVRGLCDSAGKVERVEPAECVAAANGVIVIPYSRARSDATDA